MPTASSDRLSSTTTSASQNRINRLRQNKQTHQQQQQQQVQKQSQSYDVKQANPAATNLLEKRKQMKERRLKRAEGDSAATRQESPQQERVSRDRKMEMVKRHRAHKQAQSKSTNEDQNLSPRSMDNEETDDDTLVSVRRIVANSSPDHHYQSSSNSNPSPYHQQPQKQIQPQTQYQSNYNSLSDNMHSLQQYSKVNKKSKRSSRQKQSQAEQRYGLDEEKSDKLLNRGGAGGSSSFLTASSSEYDTDKESQLTGLERQSFSKSLDDANDYTTSHQKNDDNYYSSRSYPRRLNDDDDRTFDYGDRDDDDETYSADSGSYAARRLKEAERRKMLAAEMDSPKADSTAGNISESPFINKEDAEHFRKKMDSINSPALRIAAGVAGAATIGVLVGPVGLLVGAAALSIGFSVSQIPEEDRGKLQTKAAASLHELHDKACDVSESLGNTCATHYHESGVAEHIPPQVVEHLQCLSNADRAVLEEEDGVVAATTATNANNKANADNNLTMDVPSHGAGSTGMGTYAGGRGQPSVKASGGDPRLPSPTKPERPYPKNKRNKKVACLRNVRIVPAGQIYGLDPAAQPRAWLDVVANANTSHDEKNEAMEEILLLAKDKRRARILLEEGILDYIIWEVGRYLEKVNNSNENWKYPDVTPNERIAAKQAAVCCVTLGKAHCAAIHTEGDLQLMSLYDRGIVPEERQVAQMLHEVPHHVRITNTPDPTIVDPSKEVFAYRELDLAQAEELAKSVKLVADGKI